MCVNRAKSVSTDDFSQQICLFIIHSLERIEFNANPTSIQICLLFLFYCPTFPTRRKKDSQFSTISSEKHMQFHGIYFCLSLLFHTNKSHLFLIQSEADILQTFFSYPINVSNHFSHIFNQISSTAPFFGMNLVFLLAEINFATFFLFTFSVSLAL